MKDSDLEDVAVDLSGYIGVFHRNGGVGTTGGNTAAAEKNLKPLKLEELARIFTRMPDSVRNIKLADIMRTIKQIDMDNNGYVTSTELDDILRINCAGHAGL